MAEPQGPSIDPSDATLIATDGPPGALGSSATVIDPSKPRRPPPPASRRRGDALGRYVVLGALGQGGMGVVFAAYDPELERKVAIKLLLDAATPGTTDGQAWLSREAQAMAQLAHPNVVAVHDVGRVDGQLYIAMEYVEGETLSAWLAASPRSWREILDVFLQAGEGLHAAHTAGLVHRDFKPDNVMISADGRARVMDFGLARADRAQPSPRAPLRDTVSALDSVLTRVGAIMGTPRYMAPEQWAGVEADARSDLFSYCVALWEALYGAHPFAGESMADLAIAVTGGRLRPTPPGSRVPSRLRRALARGLAPRAEERWISMRALLDELRRDPTPMRRRWTAIASIAIVAVVGLVGWRVDHRAKAEACRRDGQTIASAWTIDARARIREAFVAAGIPSVVESLASIDRLIGGYIGEWSEIRDGVCVDATIEGTIDDDTYRRIVGCLDEQRDEVAALIETFTQADKSIALRGAAAAASLRPPRHCTDRRWLGPYEPFAPALAGPAGALRRAFARMNAMIAASEFDQADRVAAAAELIASRLQIPILEARVDLAIGMVAQRRGDSTKARESLESAYYRAAALGADELASEASSRLTFVVGYRLAEPKTGLAWARLADVALARLGAADDDYRRAIVANGRGVIALAAGEDIEAERYLREALRVAERYFGPEHPSVASAYGNIGTLLWSRGAYDEALKLHQRSLDLRARVFGPDHPDVAIELNNLGANLQALGRPDEALANHKRALQIRLNALGPESTEVAESLDNLCTLYAHQEESKTEDYCRRAIEIRDRIFGPDSPHATYARIGLIVRERERHRYGQAAEVDRIIHATEAALGVDTPELASSLHLRALIALTDENDPSAALLYAERSRRLNGPGLSRTESVGALATIGEAELALGRPFDAASVFDLALEEFSSRTHADIRLAAQLRFGLATALTELGRDPVYAHRLVVEARGLVVDYLEPPLLPADADRLLELQEWLDAHPAPN